MKLLAFFCCFFVALGVELRAEESPVDILIITKTGRDKDEVSSKSAGAGVETTNTQTFKARITNKSLDPIKNLEVKLYVVGGDNVWKESDKEYEVIKVLEQGGIDLGVPGDVEVDMGEVEFKSTQTATSTTLYRGGIVYEGYAAVFLVNGKEIGTKVFGGKEIKKAFEAFTKKKRS